MKTTLKTILVLVGVLILIYVGLLAAYIMDSEEILAVYLKEETEVVLPENYKVLSSSGYLLADSTYYKFQFDDTSFSELINSIRATRFFGDTLVCYQLVNWRWDPEDPLEVYKTKGLWIESDTSFFFMETSTGYVGAPHLHIVNANLDKRTKILDVTMML